jgi:hypothetical protein
MRIHLFEFEDQNWLPKAVRKGVTDYLRYVFKVLNFYSPAIPIIAEGLNKTNENCIIELCSGGGGPVETMQKKLFSLLNRKIKIILTDKYPNVSTYEYIKTKTNGDIDYISDSVDATKVHGEIKGFRTMFTAFHHFKPEEVIAILKNAVDQSAGIAIFDVGDKNFFTLFGNLILNPVTILLCTPFFRPFSFLRIFYTYLIPLIPFCAMWDGVVSMFRLYSVTDVIELTKQLNSENYTWKVGKVKSAMGLRMFYLVGYPEKQKKMTLL